MKKDLNLSVETSANHDGQNFVQVENENFSSGDASLSKTKITIIGNSSISLTLGGTTIAAKTSTEEAQTKAGQHQTLNPEATQPTEDEARLQKVASLETKMKELNEAVLALKVSETPANLKAPHGDEKAAHSLTQPAAQQPLVQEGEQEKWKKEGTPSSIQSDTREDEKDNSKRNLLLAIILGLLLLLLLIGWSTDWTFRKGSGLTPPSAVELTPATPGVGIPLFPKDTVFNLPSIIENGARIHTDYIVYGVQVGDGLKIEHLKPLMATFHTAHQKAPLEKNKRIRSATVFSNGEEFEYEYFFYSDGKGQLRIVHHPSGQQDIFADYRWHK